MKPLLDTHLLLWAAGSPNLLPEQARQMLDDMQNQLFFSAASLWEIAIKRGLGRDDFQVDARVLRRGWLDNGYNEIPIGSDHAVFIESLPPIHKDPFDRILVAQANVEGITLLTADALVAKFRGPFGWFEVQKLELFSEPQNPKDR
jgi:PIN domain nuclease of toxin-antitoxin system